ncbi:hypothetical protein B0I08_108116 [Glaciihabitans tibetensis]|uniref:Uncharacterized protein n=1 Tax=Glaciihabitans tibetensis TaxID=1266600 RepID=A0A2T0VA24_9MICO|nr:hypothetical protein [Glaciihabitans tibetensis]PRY67032.1 hypothetical protein B0I08_108116 [Glaciihabitans tibetensis]
MSGRADTGGRTALAGRGAARSAQAGQAGPTGVTVQAGVTVDVVTSLRRVEIVLAVLGAVAAAFIALDVGGPIRVVIALAAWLLVPGWSVVRRLDPRDLPLALGLTVVASAAIHTLVSLVLVWTEFWRPQIVEAAVILAASLVIVLWPPRSETAGSPLLARSRARPLALHPTDTLLWLPLLAAAVLWPISLAQTDVDNLGDWGLLPAYPPIWFVSVALVFATLVIGLLERRIPPLRMTAGLVLLVAILNGSASLLENVPRLPWAYKHLAVSRYIDTFGSIDPSIDLYNRWPGFFAMSTALEDVLGLQSTVGWASFAELVFALVDACLVLAIARTLSRNAGVGWTAAIVFTICNWVGQNYFSPQAFGLTIYLAVALLALRYLGRTPARLPGAVERLIARVLPVKRGRLEELPSTVSRGTRIGVVAGIIVLQFVVTASHQLTPYLIVLALAPLFIIGYLRPWWLGIVLVAIPVLYLLPHYAYMQEKFGLFTGFNPFTNVTYKPVTVDIPTAAGALQSQGVVLLSALTIVVAFAGFVRRIFAGQVRTTLIVAWLAMAPAVTLLAQSYGGEAKFRVFLFGLPWFSMGVAWLFWPAVRLTRRAAVALISTLTVMLALFVATYFQPEADLRVSANDVEASNWIDSRVKWGDSVVTFGPPFPTLTGPNYGDLLATPQGLAVLSDFGSGFPGGLNASAVLDYVDVSGVRGDTYIVFSDSQEDYGVRHDVYAEGQLDSAERMVQRDIDFDPVFGNAGVRVYKLTALPMVGDADGDEWLPGQQSVAPLDPSKPPSSTFSARRVAVE